MNRPTINRRSALKSLSTGVSLFALNRLSSAKEENMPIPLKGRIKQSVSRGFWGKYPWEEFLTTIKDMGIVGVDLVGAKDWPIIKQYGLIATMTPGAGGIEHGINEKALHTKQLEDFKKNIKATAEAGWSNVITLAGGRHNMTDEEGLENCVLILKEAVKYAEEANINICMELLNSKVDHPGYMCDHTSWGVEVCKRVGSPRMKLLYDIYHMQIMEGDLIRTIQDNIEYIGHFHTAGNPGRFDLDDQQEIQYKPIMEVIAKLTEEGKYNGYVAHEFGPKHKFDSLRQAVEVCDV